MAQLAQSIKAKYPQYANVPDDQLEQRVVAKYPQYARLAQPKRSVGGFLGNVASSTGRLIGDTVSGIANVFNPDMEQNTVANLGKLGFDTAKLLAGDKAETNRARQLGAYYKQRYGKDLGKTLYEDPAGVLGDLSVVLGGAGVVAKAGRLGKLGGQLSRAGAFVDPIQMAGRGAMAGVRKITPSRAKISGQLRQTGDDLVTKGLGNPAKQADLYRKGKTNAADIFDRYDLYDRDPGTAGQAKRRALNEYDSLAMKSGSRASLSKLLEGIDSEIAKMQHGAERYTDSGQSMIQELQRRKQQLLEYVDATENATPLPEVGRLTEFRRALDADIPKSQFGLDPKGSGTAQGAKKMRDMLRETINSTDPRLERLGLDYGVLKGLEDVFTKAESRAANRQAFGFGDVMRGGMGGLVGGIPGAVTGVIVGQVANNPKVLRAGSKGFKSVANAVEKGPTPKVPQNVFRTIRAGYNTGRADRILNPNSQTTQSTVQTMPQTVAGGLESKQRQLTQKPNISKPTVSYKRPKVVIPKANANSGRAFGRKVTLKRSSSM